MNESVFPIFFQAPFDYGHRRFVTSGGKLSTQFRQECLRDFGVGTLEDKGLAIPFRSGAEFHGESHGIVDILQRAHVGCRTLRLKKFQNKIGYAFVAGHNKCLLLPAIIAWRTGNCQVFGVLCAGNDFRRGLRICYNGTMKNILIVEDERPESLVLSESLAREGFSVGVAKDGVEGLESALSGHPDLILLDIVMPKMDGITMLQKLRTDPWGKTVPVVILSVLTYDDLLTAPLREKQAELNPAQFLVKSDWKIKDIIVEVKKRLGES